MKERGMSNDRKSGVLRSSVKNAEKRSFKISRRLFGCLSSVARICIMLIAPLIFIACNQNESNKMLALNKLNNEIDTESIVKISTLVNVNSNYVCVLHPYQDRLKENNGQHNPINKYLQDIDYKGTEGQWALVFLKEGVVNISVFKRTNNLDLLSTYGLKNPTDKRVPKNFESVECAEFGKAAFLKTTINNQNFLIFGSVE